MKKCLLALSMSLLLGSSIASAEAVKAPFTATNAGTVQSRAATDDGYELRFCGDLYTWYRLTDQSNTTYRCYIEITPEVATLLAGNTLNDISFSVVLQSANTKPGSIFVSEDLSGDPLISQDVTIKSSYNNGYGGTQTEVLTEPYVIKEGVGFAFGYTVTKCSTQDYPVGIDANGPTAFAGKADVFNSKGSLLGTTSIGEEAEANIFLFANTIGDKHSLSDVFSVNSLSLGGDFTLPVVKMSDGVANAYAVINNLGSNPIKSIDYTYSVNGGNATSATMDIDVAPESTDVVFLPIEGITSGRGKAEVSITSINGLEYNVSSQSTFIAIDGEGYDRKFVVEEGTGTWCGYCPAGIVGMEHMASTYPDKFIGIAVHSGDNMATTSYSAFIDRYFEGFPSSVVNRDPIFSIYPDAGTLEMAYEYWLNQAAVADVDIVVRKDANNDKTLKVESTTVFAFDDAPARYALAFVITEDGITALQSNYYTGSGSDVGGWENKPSKVAWTFSDTAMDIFDVWGLNNSIPASVEKDTPYKFDYSLNLKSVKKVENTAVTALILDKATRTILNAKRVKYADYADPEEDGISDITADVLAPVEYYNIQGVRMDGDNLPAGLYIIRQGDKVQKTIIR